MDAEKLYQGLQRLSDKGEIGDAYSGCGYGFDDPDIDVLNDFFDFIMEKFENAMPNWAEAFIQIYSWQFQTLHECAEAYYENFYGDSEYETIMRVAGYLRENGYEEIAQPYEAAAVDCERYQYPKEKVHLLPDDWVRNNEETIWNFYVDILTKNKLALLK